MHKKRLLTVLLCFAALMAVPQVAKAATMLSCELDKDTYLQGQTGMIEVIIYNDENDKIRVTELSATINYYYADGLVYMQKFFTDAVLPDEIQMGQSTTYRIPVSLPNNIASGFTNPAVEARTELYRDGRWFPSDRLTYQLKLYVESPYKQMYESTQQKYEEQLSSNEYLNSMMNMFLVTTIVFALVAALLFVLFMRRPRPIEQL